MRTPTEIDIEKTRLLRLRKALPEFTIFGDHNWKIIDTQLDIIDGIIDEDEIYNMEDELGESGISSALDAFEWINGTRNESLVSDDDLETSVINKIEKEVTERAEKRRERERKKNTLEGFRTRWKRWLGQKCRIDKSNWTTLLDSNWSSWVNYVFNKHDIPYTPMGPFLDRVTLYEMYYKAIEVATMEELRKLDDLYCQDNFERKYK